MATTIMNKKKFMAWIDKQLTDDHYIVFTQEMTGTLSVNEKKNEKKVTFAFAADSWKAPGVGHIAFGKTPMVAMSICKKEDLSESTLEMLGETITA